MRLGSKWLAAPAAGLVLLVGGIGAASAMGHDNRPARVTTNAPALTDDHGARSGQDCAGDLTDDHGATSRQDSAGDLTDDRGTVSGRDGDGTTGTVAQRARSAALAAVPGASVREVQRRTDIPGAAYQVELVQRDGTRVEVDLNANLQPVKIERSGHDG